MQITAETDYAIRAMLYLRGAAGKPAVLGEIAEGVLIPKAFLSKVLQKLIGKGLVTSKKGKHGGFLLAADPDKITMYDIVLAASGNGQLLKTTCVKDGKPCPFVKDCRVHRVWETVSSMMRMTLETNRLSQL